VRAGRDQGKRREHERQELNGFERHVDGSGRYGLLTSIRVALQRFQSHPPPAVGHPQNSRADDGTALCTDAPHR
jgi:hypothetical protein